MVSLKGDNSWKTEKFGFNAQDKKWLLIKKPNIAIKNGYQIWGSFVMLHNKIQEPFSAQIFVLLIN